jgi:hypothetical protein
MFSLDKFSLDVMRYSNTIDNIWFENNLTSNFFDILLFAHLRCQQKQ